MQCKAIELSEQEVRGLKAQKIEKLTPIQEKVYAPIMENKHVIAESETGSGKTLAYLLPLMKKYAGTQKANKVLVFVPTQELALQVKRQVEVFAKNSGMEVSAQAVFGNVRLDRQIEALKSKPVFVVGTPGRILELIEKKKITAHLVETVVFDEADKLLDKKVIEESEKVLKKLMRDVQKLFFSASMTKAAVEAAETLALNAVVIRQMAEQKIPKNITHTYVVVRKNERIEILRKLLSAYREQKCMVFFNGAFGIEEAVQKLQYHHYSVEAIYGNSTKEQRKKAMEGFHCGKLKTLIATDLAARGLHFDGIDVVIHATIPQNAKEYQHRAGRCGRNGRHGISICLITENEMDHIHKFGRQLGIQFVREESIKQNSSATKSSKKKERDSFPKSEKKKTPAKSINNAKKKTVRGKNKAGYEEPVWEVYGVTRKRELNSK